MPRPSSVPLSLPPPSPSPPPPPPPTAAHHDLSLCLRNLLPAESQKESTLLESDNSTQHVYNEVQRESCRNHSYASSALKEIQQSLQTITQELRELKHMVEASKKVPENGHGEGVVIPLVAQQCAIDATMLDGARNVKDVRRYMNETVRNRVLCPIIPNSLPKTVESFLDEHEAVYKLENYRNVDKSTWEQRARISFSKRTYLYDRILERARLMQVGNDFQEKKILAAQQMDCELQSDITLLSLNKYIKHLKKHDPTVKKRNRKAGGIA